MTRLACGLFLCVLGASAQAAPESVGRAVETYRSKPSHAADALQSARTHYPVLNSALAVLEADSRLRAGQRLKARHLANSVATDDRWGHWASWVEARAALPDDCLGALRSLTRVRPVSGWVTEAEILDLRVRAHRRCGQVKESAEHLRVLAIEHPVNALGEAAFSRVKLTDSERLRRAQALEQARDYVRALRELEALEESEIKMSARFHRARIMLTRTRDNFEESAKLFRGLCASENTHTEEACFLQAKALGRAGDIVGALAGYSAYRERYKDGRFAADAEFFSAFLLYESGRYLQARTRFLAVRAGPWKTSAAWYAAWTAFLGGQLQAALTAFETLEREHPGKGLGRKAAYWAIRCLEQLNPAEARRRARALVSAHRFDWYSMLLRERHADWFSSADVLPAGTLKPQRLKHRVFVRQSDEIKALADAGLTRFAKQALAVAGPRIRAGGHWHLEAELAGYIGDYRRQLTIALGLKNSVLKGRPVPGDLGIWRLAYPRGFQALVNRSAARHGVSAALIYSFIRKESAFQPDAVSHAHALGLMQLLPKTASRIQAQMGKGNADTRGTRLFEPEVNIHLGAWYIAALQKRFGYQTPLVAAAYNAGPDAVISWFRGRRTAPVDVFVESIPFRETREYVKRLSRTLEIYRRLGDSLGPREMMRSTLDLTIRPGVSF